MKATDGRRRPIRGLWVRNNHYYAQLSVMDHAIGKSRTKRIALKRATTVAEAVMEMHNLLRLRRDGKLCVAPKAPTFTEAADNYLAYEHSLHDGKRESTLAGERKCVRSLKGSFGGITLDRITPAMVKAHMARRQSVDKVCGRSVNHELIILGNVFKHSETVFGVKFNPMDGVDHLPYKANKKPLADTAEIEALRKWSVANLKYGQLISDFCGFLALTGARRSEGLTVAWSDVDMVAKRVRIGGYRKSKNGDARLVDMSPALEALLAEMSARKEPDSKWLFPSPTAGVGADIPAAHLEAWFKLAREATKAERITGFHAFRHYFASMCVMAGIDYMTIAAWLGHKDGGILIGKVYGHLNNEHRLNMAAKLGRFQDDLSCASVKHV